MRNCLSFRGTSLFKNDVGMCQDNVHVTVDADHVQRATHAVRTAVPYARRNRKVSSSRPLCVYACYYSNAPHNSTYHVFISLWATLHAYVCSCVIRLVLCVVSTIVHAPFVRLSLSFHSSHGCEMRLSVCLPLTASPSPLSPPQLTFAIVCIILGVVAVILIVIAIVIAVVVSMIPRSQ